MSDDMTGAQGSVPEMKRKPPPSFSKLCPRLNDIQRDLPNLQGRMNRALRIIDTTKSTQTAVKIFEDSKKLSTAIDLLNLLIRRLPNDELENPGELSTTKETEYNFCAKERVFPDEEIKVFKTNKIKDNVFSAIQRGNVLKSNTDYKFAFELALPSATDFDSALNVVSNIRDILMYRIAAEYLPQSTRIITKPPLIDDVAAGTISKALKVITTLKTRYIPKRKGDSESPSDLSKKSKSDVPEATPTTSSADKA